MSPHENLMIVADSDHDANMLYAVGMFVPDPFIYLRLRGRNYIVLNDLEIDRARKCARNCRVLSLKYFEKKLNDSGVKKAGFAAIIQFILRQRRFSRVLVPHNF